MAEQEPAIISPTSTSKTSITRTRPAEIVRHEIADEELDTLYHSGGGYLYGLQWTALGVFLGSLPQSLGAIRESYWLETNSIPFAFGDLVMAIITGISFGAFILLLFILPKSRKKGDKLVEQIRKRTRQQIGSLPGG